jgi:signal transduction histidine kinase
LGVFGGRAWRRARSSAIFQFAASALIVVLLVAVAETFILRRMGRNEAVRDARSATTLLGTEVVEPALEAGLLDGEPAAMDAVDEAVRRHVLSDQVMRVKLWEPSGRIVYSDEERLIGSVYPMRHEDRIAFGNQTAVAEITDLDRPENRFERSEEKVLEVYYPVHLPDGTPLMFETYMPYSSVAQSGNRVWLTFVAPLIGGLIFLELVQIPLAWSVTRKMARAQQERERLLKRAIDSSNLERLRIAADLHDGVVQDLAGISYSVRAMADRVADTAPADVTSSLRDDADLTKQAVRRLRTLLVEIYPPNLQRSGLRAALSDLTSPLSSLGMDVRLGLPESLELPASVEALLFRAAQESLRNVAKHSGAKEVRVDVEVVDGVARLSVSDDGRGFAMSEGDPPRREGHFGLDLLVDLANDSGGSFDIRSRPGDGTTVVLEVPL